jgi:hypothetical protein
LAVRHDVLALFDRRAPLMNQQRSSHWLKVRTAISLFLHPPSFLASMRLSGSPKLVFRRWTAHGLNRSQFLVMFNLLIHHVCDLRNGNQKLGTNCLEGLI